MATEDILSAAVAAGGDRRELHERIRRHAQAAAAQVKDRGRPNDLLERLKSDSAFAEVPVDHLARPEALVGLAPRQVDEFLASVIAPLKRRHRHTPRREPEISV
jgi:adenylosuccinate lyase